MSDARISEAGFDLDHTDRLLSTTRAIRKRPDFDRDVPDEVLFECTDLAEQGAGSRLRRRTSQ